MRKLYLLAILTSSLLWLSCGNNSDDKKTLTKEEKWETEAKKVEVSYLPSITFEEMKELYEGCDFLDFIFYNVDFSMSVKNKGNIQRIVGFVSTEVAKIDPSCEAMGRVFFQKNGELMMEADMYMDDNCQYFVFYKNGRQAYANDITPQGQAYFQQIFSQVKVEPVAPQ